MSSVIAAIGIWLMFVLVFTTLVGAQHAPFAKPPAGVDSAALKAGATVKATVEERGGQKVVTAIQVN
jgi:hypothetical protein